MCNLGKTDRLLRALVGIILLVAAYLTPYGWLAIIGAIAVGTSMISFCPLYAILGLNSGCKAKSNEEKEEDQPEA